MEIGEAYIALAGQFQKTLKGLSADSAVALAQGRSAFVVLGEGQRAIQDQPGLDVVMKALEALSPEQARVAAAIVAKAIKALTPDDLDSAAGGGCSFKFSRKGGKVTYPVNVSQIAQEVSELASEDAIIKFLDADERLKPAELRKIGGELGIGFPAAIKQRDAMIAHIARSLVTL